MEKRLLLAAALSLGVLLLWEWLVPKPAAKPPNGALRQATAAASMPSPTAGQMQAQAAAKPAASLPAPVAAAAAETTTLENAVVRVRFSNRGGVIESFVLLKHTDEEGRPLELVRHLPSVAPLPFSLTFEEKPELTNRVAAALFVLEKPSGNSIRFRYADSVVAITKEVALASDYLLDWKVSVAGPPFVIVVGTGVRNPTEREKSSSYVKPPTAIATSGGDLKHLPDIKIDKEQTWPLDPGGFAGIEDNYFLLAMLPKKTASAKVWPLVLKDPQGKPSSEVIVGVTGAGELEGRCYFGPKEIERLESLHAGLERTINFGWFPLPLIARPLYWLLKKTHSFVGNYGLAILIVTLIIRVLLFPLMHKSYVSMRKMQKLAPKMNAIRDKYKKAKTEPAQRQKMNEELMKLYQAEGYNPMSGCLPVLLQMPILFAFYYLLSQTIELRHAPFVLWIKDLSAVDNSYVLVILMIVTMYVQQAMTPSTADPTQKKIFMFMPIMMGFFMRLAPSGLVLYWLFSNILTILQQMLINRIGGKDEPKTEKPVRVKTARA